MSGCRAQPRPCSHRLLVLGRPASVSVSGSVQDPLTPGSQGSGTSRLYLPSEKCTRHLSLVQLLVSSFSSRAAWPGQALLVWGSHADTRHRQCHQHMERGSSLCPGELGRLPGQMVPAEEGHVGQAEGGTVYS